MNQYKNLLKLKKNFRLRDFNTFEKSNFLLNNQNFDNDNKQPVQRKAYAKRDEKIWTSEIFDGPKIQEFNKKVLS